MAVTAISRTIVKKVLSQQTSEVVAALDATAVTECLSQGAGAVVRRSIGSTQLRNLTPFLMLDHFHVAKGAVRYIPMLLLSSSADMHTGLPRSSAPWSSNCHLSYARREQARGL